MIQRIQTLYLFIVTILQLTSVLWIRDRLLFSGKNVDLLSHYILLIPTILLVVIPFWNIFQFKNRKGQFVVNRLLLLLSLLLMGNQLLGYMNIEAYAQDQIWVTISYLLTVILLALSNRAIKKDEDLVRAADRLR
jgi:small-conductance mechanosensitive channel